MEKTQANKLKLNATNIKSFLFGSNKKLDKVQKEKKRLIEFGEKEEKFREKEKRVESPVNLKSPLAAVKSFVLAGPMSIFDKIKEFLGIILLGMLVNNLPQIIQKIKDFFNDPFIKGTLKVLEYMGKGLYEIIKSTITFTASTQKRITQDIKQIKKDTEYLLETFGFLERDVNKDISDLQGSKPDQKNPPTPPPPPRGSAPAAPPARSVPLTYPGAPANPTPTTATQPGNNPFAKAFAKGGTVTQPDKPKKNETTQTTRTTSFSKKESGKLKKARQDMNYFENFNKSIKELAENTSFEDKNNTIYEDMVNNFKAFFDLLKGDKDKKPITPGPGPGPGPSGPDLSIDVDEKEIIGFAGSTGKSTGVHIHLENDTEKTKDGKKNLPASVKNNIIVGGKPLSSWSRTSKVGYRSDPITGERKYHYGEDWAGMRNGESITLRGGLKFVSYIPDDGGGYGNQVIIQDQNGVKYKLGHLSGGPKNIQELRKRQLEKQNVSQDLSRYTPTGKKESGEASWYGPGFIGNRTASGSRFTGKGFTAAHKTLPFGTKVKVTNKANGKSIVVEITDRGPYEPGRIIDLTKDGMNALGGSGVADVELEILKDKPIPKPGDPKFIGPVPKASAANFEGTGGSRNQNAFLPLNNKETNMVAMMMTQPVIQPYPVPVPLPMKSAPAPSSSGRPVLAGAWTDLA